MNGYLLMLTFRVWLLEIPLAAFNWFALADRVYRPRLGDLHAHQIAMASRIGWVPVLAFCLLRWTGTYTTLDTLSAGCSGCCCGRPSNGRQPADTPTGQ